MDKKAFLIAFSLLALPIVASYCLTDTERFQISNLESQLNVTNNSIMVLFEDICSKHATKEELSQLRSNMTAADSSLSSSINSSSSDLKNSWNSSFNNYMSDTNNRINTTIKSEMDKYLDQLEISSRLMDILLLLNQTTDMKQFKSDMNSSYILLSDQLNDRITNMKRDYATVAYVDSQISNATSQVAYQPASNSSNIYIYIFLIAAVAFGILIFFLKRKRDNPPPIVEQPYIPNERMEVKELLLDRFKKKPSPGQLDDDNDKEQENYSKIKPKGGGTPKKNQGRDEI